MLELMLRTGLPGARGFWREIRGSLAATCRLRNHEIMISRRPGDILELHRIRRFYEARKANLRCIVTIRDPRDAMTSQHAYSSSRRRYHLTISRWLGLEPYVRYHWNDPAALIVRYEDLVGDVARVQERIEGFIGEPMKHPFSEFHQRVPRNFRTLPLNGVRPVDRHRIGRWQLTEHRERIEEILKAVPDFPDRLVELGYEEDCGWVGRWRSQGLSRAA